MIVQVNDVSVDVVEVSVVNGPLRRRAVLPASRAEALVDYIVDEGIGSMEYEVLDE